MSTHNEGGDLSFLDQHFAAAGVESGNSGDTDADAQDTATRTEQQPGSGSGQDTGTEGRREAGVTGGQDTQHPTARTAGQRASTSQTDKGGQDQAASLRQDSKGNLVNSRGEVVLEAGSQRRLANRITELDGLLAQARNQHNEAVSRLQVYERTPKELGLQTAEVEFSMRLMHAFKSDPAGCVRWMIQQAVSKGVPIDRIVGDQQGASALQTDAIKTMINEALRPLIEREELARNEAAIDAKASEDYARFRAAHPYADVHDDVLAGMIRSDHNLSPEAAYWRLNAFAAQHGLDFSQPLLPQIQAARETGTASASQTVTALPNGTGGGEPLVLSQQSAPGGLEDTADIVRRTMREHGFNV